MMMMMMMMMIIVYVCMYICMYGRYEEFLWDRGNGATTRAGVDSSTSSSAAHHQGHTRGR